MTPYAYVFWGCVLAFDNISRREAIGLAVGAVATSALVWVTDILGLVGVSFAATRPPNAGEERNARDVPGSNNTFEIEVDGSWQIAYCMDTNWGNPANNSPYVCAGWATGALGYIAAHGFNGVIGDSGAGRLATNMAVWCFMNYGATVRTVQQIIDGFGASQGDAQKAHDLLAAAVAFHNDGSRNTATATENHAGTVWIPKNLPSGWPYSHPLTDRHVDRGGNSSCTQRMLVPTKDEDVGKLVVKKVMDGPDDDSEFTFHVSFSGNGAPAARSFTLRAGQSETIDKIRAGVRYSVSEDTPAHYQASWENQSGVISKDATITATCTNHKNAFLKLRKELDI